jgi:hypothetical protein
MSGLTPGSPDRFRMNTLELNDVEVIVAQHD